MFSSRDVSNKDDLQKLIQRAGEKNVCRSCLTGDAFEHLFREDNKLAHRYTACINLQATPGDGFPEYICTECCVKLLHFYEFRQNCLKSHDILVKFVRVSDCDEENNLIHIKDEPYDINHSCGEDSPSPEDLTVLSEHGHSEENPVEWTQDIDNSDNLQNSTKAIKKIKLKKKSSCANVFNLDDFNERAKEANSLGGRDACTVILKQTSNNNLYANKLFTCDICTKTFKSRGWLKKHIHAHTHTDAQHLEVENQDETVADPKLKLICPTCNRRYYNYRKFENHLRSHMGLPASKISCERCGKLLKTEKSLRTHMKLHDDNRKDYNCEVCNKKFRQLASFRVHQQIHNGVKRCICHVCGQSYQEQNMKVHLLRHAKERNYSCSTCNKSFVLSIELKLHQLRHQKVKTFSCTHCEKSFYTKRELDRHLTSHSDRKPYACNVCDKSFKSDSYLTVHKRDHTGERPFQCKFCERRFKRGKDLRNHTMRHTGERPYRCQYCDKAFIQKTPLNRHLQAHARNQIPKKYDKTSDDKGVNSEVEWCGKTS